MQVVEIFGELAGTIAKLNPAQVATMKAPDAVAQEVQILINKKKIGNISSEENTHLEHLLALDLFVSLMKAKARAILTHEKII